MSAQNRTGRYRTSKKTGSHTRKGMETALQIDSHGDLGVILVLISPDSQRLTVTGNHRSRVGHDVYTDPLRDLLKR